MTPYDIEFIAVHCSATPPDLDIGVKEIRDWHKRKNWSDIGYHFVIRRNGDEEAGRPMDKAGAHVYGFNSRSWGICLVGGVDKDNNPEDNLLDVQKTSLRRLINRLLQSVTDAEVKGHRDFPNVKKACPCFDVIPWWNDEIT